MNTKGDIKMSDEINYRIRFLETTFSHNHELIKLADNKANIVLRVIGMLVPLIFGINVATTSVGIESNIFAIYVLNISGIIALIGLIISFSLAISVIKARLINDEKRHNILFFENIHKKGREEYKKCIGILTEEKIIENLTTEISDISEINVDKYKYYKRSLTFLFWSVIILVIGYLFVLISNLVTI